jgi:sugar phosphate isomerase/epimerase
VKTAARVAVARPPLGIALFTVRGEATRDLPGTLARLAAMGYREVDMYPYQAGIAWAPARTRRALADAGLTCPSARVTLPTLYRAWDRTLDGCATLGATMVTVANIGFEERTTLLDWRELVALYARCGTAARARGMVLCHHNHEFELQAVEGEVPWELLVAGTDPASVRLQADVHWVRIGGRDPVREIARLGARVASLHLKDTTAGGAITTVGKGTTDFRAVLDAAAAAGVRHAFVEEDDPADPMAAARAAADHLRGLPDA